MFTSPLLARAPVVNRSQNIVGYDLRLSGPRTAEPNGHALLNLLEGESAQENFFLCLPNRFALTQSGQMDSENPGPQGSGRVVVEVNPSSPNPSDALVPQARKWKAAGYGLCLQRPYSVPILPEALDLASYFTVDVGELTGELEKTCTRLRRHPAKQIAVDVGTPERFDAGHHAGCDFFRGYFFTKPSGQQTLAVSPSYTNIVTLMKMAQETAPVAKIEQALKHDAALSFRLLRYINSAGFGLSCEIQSFRHAVAVVGYKNLYRWLALLLVTSARQSASSALVTTAITRGRLAELIGEGMFDAEERDNLFIVGAFSLLDVILKAPLHTIAEQIPISDSVLDALLRREGPYGPILSIVETTEAFDRPESRAKALEVAELLGITTSQINRAQLNALAWAEGLAR